jgi:hypothetical protein
MHVIMNVCMRVAKKHHDWITGKNSASKKRKTSKISTFGSICKGQGLSLRKDKKSSAKSKKSKSKRSNVASVLTRAIVVVSWKLYSMSSLRISGMRRAQVATSTGLG